MNIRALLCFVASASACSSAAKDPVPAPDAAADSRRIDASQTKDARSPADAPRADSRSQVDNAGPVPDATAMVDTSGAPGDAAPESGAPDAGVVDAPPDASAPDISVMEAGMPDASAPDASAPDAAPEEVQFARVGFTCSRAGAYAFGDGSLLICDGGKYRYAMRTDVPDGTYGGFVSRPSWYPRLGMIFGLSPSSCTAKLPLTAAPLDPAGIDGIIPNGLMVGAHITPIDHWYIVPHIVNLSPSARAAAAPAPVMAVADGTIIEASSLGSPTSMRVTIAHDCETISVYMVLNKLSGPLAAYNDQVAAGGFVTMKIPIKAGEIFALQRENPVDFSLHDGATWLSGFAHPFPYVSGDPWKPYTVDPLPYWPEAIAKKLEEKLQRTESPRAGKIDWDKPGTAAGNWYLEGTIGYGGHLNMTLKNATQQVPGGQTGGKNSYAWSHLSLAPHWVQPSVWIASIGTWNDPKGDFPQYALRPGPPSPADLTPAHGMVVYELVSWSDLEANGGPLVAPEQSRPIGHQVMLSSMVVGVMAVKVNANNTITVEKRPGVTSAAGFTAFTNKAETYWR